MSGARSLRPPATDPKDRQEARVAALEDRLHRIDSQVGRLINVQTINGAVNEYSPAYTTDIPVLRQVGGAALEITYTPPVDVWWDVIHNNALVEKNDATYGYSYGYLQLSTADVDGIVQAFGLSMQRFDVNRYGRRKLRRIFKLAAGTTYTVSARLSTPSVGNFRYYHGPEYLWLNAKAYIR